MRNIVIASLLIGATALEASSIPKNERIKPLLEGKSEINRLSVIEDRGLSKGQSGIDLWSGSYWPHYQGSLAARYMDPNFIPLIDQEVQYKENLALFQSLPMGGYSSADLLSPAEKYDLLVGDEEMTLTKYSWELGKKVMKGETVSTWRGLCDGWASAAQMMPRPKKSVLAHSPSGQPINFYPEDLKALGTLLYAKAQGAPHFLGKRCRSPLLIFTSACDEISPGAFHLALVNRVGAMKKTFIGDIAPGGEVWNYPVKSYSFSYYNVFDKEESTDFRAVMESYDKKDKKKKFVKHGSRHKETKFIVGVIAKVVYQNMREKNLVSNSGIGEDSILEKEYRYDLELAQDFTILGGENPAKNLPDFVWAPNDLTFPLSVAEKFNKSLDERSQAKISSKEGQPLAAVVERLFSQSK